MYLIDRCGVSSGMAPLKIRPLLTPGMNEAHTQIEISNIFVKKPPNEILLPPSGAHAASLSSSFDDI